jgi:hypothetical protein
MLKLNINSKILVEIEVLLMMKVNEVSLKYSDDFYPSKILHLMMLLYLFLKWLSSFYV